MFGKRSSQAEVSLGKERFATILGERTTIKGDLELSDGVRIDGCLLGNARAIDGARVTVVVGTTGTVTGDISSGRVVVAGAVQGAIAAEDDVELLASAVVQGDIHCKSLRVMPGARLIGRIHASEPMPVAGKPVLVVDHQDASRLVQLKA